MVPDRPDRGPARDGHEGLPPGGPASPAHGRRPLGQGTSSGRPWVGAVGWHRRDLTVSISPVRLNHAVLFVADLARSERFYRDVFGMEVIAREPRADAAFLRLPRSANHHDLGLFAIGAGAGPERRGIGLYHLAWQLDTIDELGAAREVLLAAGAYTGESSHGATKSIYGADPDGNEFEIMWMLPRDAWGEYERAAPVEHLDLAGDLRRWSGVRTAGAIVPAEDETRS